MNNDTLIRQNKILGTMLIVLLLFATIISLSPKRPIKDTESQPKQKQNIAPNLNQKASSPSILVKPMVVTPSEQRPRVSKVSRDRVDQSGRLTWPVPGHYEISSRFGSRKHPIDKNFEFHRGVDIPAPKGTEVVASSDGVVIFVGYLEGYGRCIYLSHNDGTMTEYKHLFKYLIKESEIVKRGQPIGRVGSSGKSTGSHLEYSVFKDGKYLNPTQLYK